MITDLECNAVSRGAVELYNLASRMEPGDALAAEALQTFASVSIDARSWSNYLDQVHSGDRKLQRSVVFGRMDVRKQLHRFSKPCWFMMYGYRPTGYPFTLLSGIEFMRHWEVLPVLPPGETRYRAWFCSFTDAGTCKRTRVLHILERIRRNWNRV